MKPKVEGSLKLHQLQRTHAWGPDIALAGICFLFHPRGVSFDHICLLFLACELLLHLLFTVLNLQMINLEVGQSF